MLIPAALLAMLIGPLSAGAQNTVLDAPSVSFYGQSRSSITLDVEAGATGAPGGVTVHWITKTLYNALGGNWPANEGDPRIYTCTFNGTPTLNTTNGTTTFVLGAGEHAIVEMGDIFDETGYTANYLLEALEGTEYAFRVRAAAATGYDRSVWTPTQFSSTLPRSAQDCTYTQGYYKNHPNNWATNSLFLGNVLYNQSQLLQILAQPAQGNGLVFMAHQLIAAKLNAAAGAVVPAGVQAAMNAADALIGNLVIPPIGAGYIAPSQASGFTQTMDSYNNGAIGPGHCGAVPVEMSTWGGIKALYR